MILNLEEIREKTVPATDYINSLEELFREKFLARKQAYKVNQEAVRQLKESAGNYVLIVFSATWCKDCAANVPVLALISEVSGLEVRVFGGLKKDPLALDHKWRIPPSPQEVETLNVEKIPLIIIADGDGREVGRIAENPTRQPTLEQELCQILIS
jgi:hypothetical protein